MRISQSALDKCEPLFAEFIDVMGEIGKYHARSFQDRHDSRDLHSETLRVLVSYELDRSQAAYCLIVNGLVWDAEIIVRALYETVAKILLIATADTKDREDILTEYWEVLPAIYDRKGAQKAQAAENLARRFGSPAEARVFAHLRNPEIYKIDPTGNKRLRREIEQRWSFSGIVDSMRKKKPSEGGLDGIEALSHIYGMSSHLAHASPKALDMMHDRVTRGKDLQALEVAHICRMLSDMTSLACFGAYLCERSWTGVTGMPGLLAVQFKRMHDCTQPYQTDFDRSQDDFYAQWTA